MTKKKYDGRIYLFLLILVLIILLSTIFWKSLISLFSNIRNIKLFVLDYGIFAPLVFILLQVIQIIIAPIPGQITGFASGYIFGTFLGIIYSMIGVLIGCYISFIFSRKLGRPFVERFVNPKILKKFDYITKNKCIFPLFLIYLLPALPDDTINFIAGLTKIKIRTLMLISFFGRLPGFVVLNLVGNGVAVSAPSTAIIIFSLTLLISLFVFLFRNKIENLMLSFIQYLKEGVK